MTLIALSTTAWWAIGYAVAAVVVVIVAALLIVAIRLVGGIVRQAAEISAVLDRTRANTEPLLAIAHVNDAVERTTHGLATLRQRAAAEAAGNGGSGGLVGRLKSLVTSGDDA